MERMGPYIRGEITGVGHEQSRDRSGWWQMEGMNIQHWCRAWTIKRQEWLMADGRNEHSRDRSGWEQVKGMNNQESWEQVKGMNNQETGVAEGRWRAWTIKRAESRWRAWTIKRQEWLRAGEGNETIRETLVRYAEKGVTRGDQLSLHETQVSKLTEFKGFFSCVWAWRDVLLELMEEAWSPIPQEEWQGFEISFT